MRDDHKGLPGGTQLPEEPQHVEGRRGVQVAGRLVGQQHQRIVGQGAGDGHPLTLSARELPGQMPGAVGQPDLLQQLVRAAPGRAQ